MTMSRRVILGFATIIILLVLYGTYVQFAFSIVRNLTGIHQQITRVQSIVVGVKSDTLSYQKTGERNYIYRINSRVLDIQAIVRRTDFSRLSEEVNQSMQDITKQLIDFQIVMSDAMVIHDQVNALNQQIIESTAGINTLVQNVNIGENPDDAVNLVAAFNILLGMNGHIIAYANDHVISATTFENEVAKLEAFAQVLTDTSEDTSMRLLGVRLRLLSRQQSDFFAKAISHHEQESLFQNEITALSEKVERIVTEAIVEEEKMFKSRSENFILLSLLLLAAFIIIATVAGYSIYQHIKKSISKLVKATEDIAIGEYTEHLTLAGDKDMQSLSVSINKMAEHIEDQQHAMEVANLMLEIRVDEKTRELNHANKDLERINENLMEEKEHLAFVAMTDYLTRIKNRGYLVEYLKHRTAEASRYGSPFCVVLFDVDRFKHVNDTFGHHIGDEVLVFIANVLQNEVRESDVVGRYGGEEFMVIFAETAINESYLVAERIRAKIDEHIFDQDGLHVTISGGLLQYTGESQIELLQKVDKLLYQAKAAGRNCIISSHNPAPAPAPAITQP